MVNKVFVSEFNPISVKDNVYKVQWGFNEQEGTCYELEFNFKPSLDTIKTLILAWYNKEIDNKILSEFVWKDMPIWLSQENQFNYKAAYDLAIQTKGASLPITMKFGSDTPVYYTFTNLEDFTDFYTESIKFIQETLYEGWVAKDGINWEDYKI